METTAGRTHAGGRTLAGLFTDLWRETSTLVHEEAELAKAEVSEKVSQVGSGVAAMAVAGAILFAGFLMLLFAAAGAIALMVPPETTPWLPALIVGVVVLIIGLFALAAGRSKLQAENLKPTRSIASLRRDGELVKEHVA